MKNLEEFIFATYGQGDMGINLCISIRSEFLLWSRQEFKEKLEADLGLSPEESGLVISILEVEYGIN